MQSLRSRPVIAWALYDWANSAYATVVMAGFFPIFFKEYWTSSMEVSESTFWLGIANGAAGLLVALAAPLLGAMADQGGLKKRLLFIFTFLGVLMTCALFLLAQGAWELAVVVYVMGAIGFAASNVFYDAMIVDVAEYDALDRVSAFGYGLGYIGGGMLFAGCVFATLKPALFGLSDAAEAVRYSFMLTGIWWTLFALPIFLFVHEQGEAEKVAWLASARQGWRQFVDTFAHVRKLRVVMLFLLAYFFYIDGVGTVIRMAVDYGLSLGFTSDVLIQALLLTQFVAFPAAIAWGWIGERIGGKRSIMICIAVYMLVCIWGYSMDSAFDFYLLATVIGLVMGGIQALSRSMYARLIPRSQATEFFGFYNMLGKFAAIMGPMLMGLASLLTGSARLSILAILVLFAAGALLLYRVNEIRYEEVEA